MGYCCILAMNVPQENSASRGHCKAMLGPVSCNSPDSLFNCNPRVQVRFMMSPSFDNKRVNSKKYVQATLRRPVIEFLFLYLLVVQFDDEAVLIFSLTMIQPQNSHWIFTQTIHCDISCCIFSHPSSYPRPSGEAVQL